MSKHFTFEERLQLKRKLEDNLPICQIAEELNKNKSTVYNELKRGKKINTICMIHMWHNPDMIPFSQPINLRVNWKKIVNLQKKLQKK